MRFKFFINEFNTNAFLGMGLDGLAKPFDLPNPSLELPTKMIKGKIQEIKFNQNPIKITTDNGSVWHLSKGQWDYLLKNNKKPRINSEINVEVYLDGRVKSCKIQ